MIIRAEVPKRSNDIDINDNVSHLQRSNHSLTFYTGLRCTSPCAFTYRGFAPF